MLPLKIIDENSVEYMTNGVIDHVVKNNNIENTIVGIPSQNLERKLPHDINIFNIYKNEFDLDEIKVLSKKKNISINELTYLRFRYDYVNNLYIGCDINININDIEINKNIKLVNEQENIYNFFEKNFETNRFFFRNKYLLSASKETIISILKECNMNIELKKEKVISLLNENDNLVRIVDNKINYILENRNNMNNINNINENLFFEKHFIQKEVFDNKMEFTPKIKFLKIDVTQYKNIKYKSGIIEEFRYNDKFIKNRDKILIKLLKNLKK